MESKQTSNQDRGQGASPNKLKRTRGSLNGVVSTLVPSEIHGLRCAFRDALPFPHIQLNHPFDPELISSVRDDLIAWEGKGCGWVERNNDLYSFKQSDALANVGEDSPSLRRLTTYLYSSEFRSLVEGITGVQDLADTIDASAASYRSGDYLLCHDDDLLTRRVAFILYLTPENWEASDGGKLELFSVDPTTHAPSRISASISPRYGSMVLFEVTPASFHAVGEVLDDSKGHRLSISGWFHGKNRLPRPPLEFHSSNGGVVAFLPPLPTPSGFGKAHPLYTLATPSLPFPLLPLLPSSSHALEGWVNPLYLKKATAAAVGKRLREEGGALLLPSFLTHDAFSLVARALGTAPWRHVGPPVLQSYRTLGAVMGGYNTCPVETLLNIFCSESFRELLSNFVKPVVLGDVAGKVRAFTQGDYTIITDPEYLAKGAAKKASRAGLLAKGGSGGGGKVSWSKPEGSLGGGEDEGRTMRTLEANFYAVLSQAGEWDETWGGVTTYLTADTVRESVSPQTNSLCLVLREPELLSFVKHVSSRCPEPIYDFNMQYRI